MTGNVILKRYLQNTRWARGATNKEDLRRFTELTGYFKKYATQYDFDWLLLVAQGYQESGLDQSTRSPVGAIGVMQVMPTTAEDRNVAIKDIHLIEPNIHAGVKYMRFLVNQYFDEPGIDRVNRHLFAFAAYNARSQSHCATAQGGRRRAGWTRTSGSTTSNWWSPRTSAARPSSTSATSTSTTSRTSWCSTAPSSATPPGKGPRQHRRRPRRNKKRISRFLDSQPRSHRFH